MVVWKRLSNNLTPANTQNVPLPIRARAYSCLAAAYLQRGSVYEAGGRRITNIDAMYLAAQAADACAALGLTSPSVLQVGQVLQCAQYRSHEPPNLRFIRLENLWEAVDKRTAELSVPLTKQQTKVQRNPDAFLCSAGCGIEATSKSGLKQCAGPCSPATKPSYCSKECQRKVSIPHSRPSRNES